MWSLAWLAAASAYESDTLTERDEPLPDVTDELDEWVDLVVIEAVLATNERTRCRASPEEAAEVLAREIHGRTAANELVTNRGGLRAFGFDQLSAWIEKGGVPHRDFVDRRDLFGDVTFQESPILKWAGVCSTVQVAGQLVGTDKLDHFFEEGFHVWRRSREGAEFTPGMTWAVRTENGKYGLETSETFSFGDLRADLDGATFYGTLLDPERGVAVVGDDGCLQLTRPFTWRDRITWEYDEVLNPPVYTPEVQLAVTRHLEANREAYCASYSVWGDGYSEHLREVMGAALPYVTTDAPTRTDPFRLDQLCSATP